MSRADCCLFVVSFAAALALFFGLAQEPWENTGLLLVFIALLGVVGAFLARGLLQIVVEERDLRIKKAAQCRLWEK